jgi:hypothetical protein
MKRMKTEKVRDQIILSIFGDNVFGFLGMEGEISEHTKND